MQEELDRKLEAYADSDYYPFHMPGHKRRALGRMNPYCIDITEIEGFDHLHGAEGILKEAQIRAAELYGAKNTYYLVNGSTCGILTAISAVTKRGDKILMARNVHKAVYHAVFLNGLVTRYLNPVMTGFGIQGAIDPREVERQLKCDSDIAALVITSPTYEGIVSDIEAISEIAHTYQIPLIVDEAHGAHFGFHDGFPQTSVRQGADVVVQSMHKVLPSLTQTALLHVNSERVSIGQIETYLDIYETSSPSYVLMAGMEKCIRLLREEGEALFCSYAQNLHEFYEKTLTLEKIKIMRGQDFSQKEAYAVDPSKIVISVKNTNIDGEELYKELLEHYHLQMEMVSGFYVLAMTSIMDTREGLQRLYQALEEIDQKILQSEKAEHAGFIENFYRPMQKKLEICQAAELPVESVSFEEAIGKISGCSVYLYPPGIPVLLPGEIIDADFIKNLRESIKLRLNLQGIADIINERINIVNF